MTTSADEAEMVEAVLSGLRTRKCYGAGTAWCGNKFIEYPPHEEANHPPYVTGYTLRYLCPSCAYAVAKECLRRLRANTGYHRSSRSADDRLSAWLNWLTVNRRAFR